MKELSIILVNWNCIDLTVQCIDSLYLHFTGVDFEVIVVDNASLDAPCARISERFPEVKVILSKENIGFGRANNLGVRHAKGKKLFFLNPDTVVIRDAVQEMLCVLRSASDIGVVGCRLLNPDGTLQMSSVQRFPTVLNQLLAIEKLQRIFPRWSFWNKGALEPSSKAVAYDVDVVSGAAMLMSRETFTKAGGFNPEYFMYAEEVDLCYEVKRCGSRVVHCGSAEITHFGGQSTKKCEDGFADIAMRESVQHFFLRKRGPTYAVLYRAGLFLSASLRLFLVTLLTPFISFTGFPISEIHARRIVRKWGRIARWSVGLESGARIISSSTPTTSASALEN